MGIEIYSKKCKQYVKLPKIQRVRKDPLTKEVLVRVFSVLSLKLKTVFLVVLSSWMRIEEIGDYNYLILIFPIHQLKSELGLKQQRQEKRETYFSSDTTVILKDYLRRYFGW